MKYWTAVLGLLVMMCSTGCAPLLVGAGAVGTYKVASDERKSETMFGDSAITATIKTELIKDELVQGRKIDVDSVDGNVILSGVVESELQAARAVEIAKQYEGVKSVKNNMRIGSKSFSEVVDDKVLGAKVKAKLINEPKVSSMNIDVDVHVGIVTLSGIVENEEARGRVLRAAREVEGVTEIVDNLRTRY